MKLVLAKAEDVDIWTAVFDLVAGTKPIEQSLISAFMSKAGSLSCIPSLFYSGLLHHGDVGVMSLGKAPC